MTRRRKINPRSGNTNLVGRKTTFTTYEGLTLVGTIESFEGCRPIIRFDDGRWAYGDNRYVTLVD
jgi:hypothetical protein